jgi:calcineurin-like phosphoesterase
VEEKEALGMYLDGEASAVVGTHTHVQTADERILSGGTAYITDIGMSGPADSVIGMKKETAVARSLTQMPLKMEVQNSAAEIMGVLIELDPSSGKALSIERVRQLSSV